MDWFKRHLNWTSSLIAIGSLLFIVFLIPFTFGSYNFPTSSLPFLILLGLLFYILSMISHGWVLFHKNRSLLFLIFYLPAAVFYSIALKILSFSWFSGYWPTSYAVCVISFLVILFIGWIVLLFLRNCTIPEIQESAESKSDEIRKHRLYNFYQSTKKVRHTVFSLVGAILIVLGGSVLYFNYGHLTYRSDDFYTSEIPIFSLEYPVYYRINKSRPAYVELHNGFDSAITVEVIHKTWPTDEQTLFNALFDRVTIIGIPAPENLPYTTFQTLIDSIPATGVSLFVEHNGDYPGGYGTGVLVKRKNTYWLITLINRWGLNEPNRQTPGYFTHLLQSFKFHDQ